jgi:hypothetical protein
VAVLERLSERLAHALASQGEPASPAWPPGLCGTVTPERHARLAGLLAAVAGDFNAYLRALVSWWCLTESALAGPPGDLNPASVAMAIARVLQSDPARESRFGHTLSDGRRAFNTANLCPTEVQVSQIIYLGLAGPSPSLGYRLNVASAEAQRVPASMRIAHVLLRYDTTVKTRTPVRVGAFLDIPELPDMPMWPGSEVADELAVCWARLNRWRDRVLV